MSDKTKIGVLLAGAGYLDGAEISEAVICLLALSQADVEVHVYAPDVDFIEINHLDQKQGKQRRNVLKESARIARGAVADLKTVNGNDVDGWIIPGGFGAAKNLCDFATKGTHATANKEVSRVIRSALAGRTPIGACCIAPALLCAVTKKSGPHLKVTIGTDKATAATLEDMGATHIDAQPDETVVDEQHLVVSSPAYMFDDARLADIYVGLKKMVDQVVGWAQET